MSKIDDYENFEIEKAANFIKAKAQAARLVLMGVPMSVAAEQTGLNPVSIKDNLLRVFQNINPEAFAQILSKNGIGKDFNASGKCPLKMSEVIKNKDKFM